MGNGWWKTTFETATWNAYSVIRSLVLLEMCTRIAISESLFLGRDSWKEIAIAVFDTTRWFELGRIEFSSGSAEVKSQSSSIDGPLLSWEGLGWGVGGFNGWLEREKSNIDPGGTETGRFDCWGLEKGDACRRGGEARMEKGSDEFGREEFCGCWIEGVDDRDVGYELVRDAKGS